MPIDTWFPLAVYYTDLADAEQPNAELRSHILAWEAQASERRNLPEMAWTGDLHGIHQIHRDPHFAWLVKQVETHTRLYLQELGVDLAQVDLYIQRAWPVISRQHQEVGAHCHNTAHVSAVYYISVPANGTDASGCLTFIDDVRMNEVSPGLGSENTDIVNTWTALNQDQALYLPTEGRLILFPAKQRHAVTMNHTADPRISVSFDIILTATPSVAGIYEFLTPPPSQWQKFSP